MGDKNTWSLWEVQYSYQHPERSFRNNGRRWVLAKDLDRAIHLVRDTETVDADMRIHAVIKRSADLYFDTNLIVDWDGLHE